MSFLLDVNVLIALIDPSHVNHDAAHDWFEREGFEAWATCPLTENGVIRIVGQPRYPNTPGSPAKVARLVAELRAVPGHTFWSDDISLVDTDHVSVERLLTAGRVTDSYLLALAIAHGGKLVTFDRKLSVEAVAGGKAALRVLV